MFQFEGNKYSLRPACEEDLDQVLSIEKRSYPKPWTRAGFEAELTKPHSHFLVLSDDETDTQVVGYIVYWMMSDFAHLLNVTVEPEWRGLGIAQKLIQKLKQEALRTEMKRLVLEVRKSNEAALHLYQKEGFAIDGIKKRHYSDGEDAYSMTLELTKEESLLV